MTLDQCSKLREQMRNAEDNKKADRSGRSEKTAAL